MNVQLPAFRESIDKSFCFPGVKYVNLENCFFFTVAII